MHAVGQDQGAPHSLDVSDQAARADQAGQGLGGERPISVVGDGGDHTVVALGRFNIGDLDIQPYEQKHGFMPSTGFRFGDVAYSTDLVELPPSALEVLEGVDTFIVQALRPDPHPTHAHLDLALDWIEKIAPRRAVVTHMNHQMDYDTLCRQLPDGVEPAYDGMVIDVPRT